MGGKTGKWAKGKEGGLMEVMMSIRGRRGGMLNGWDGD